MANSNPLLQILITARDQASELIGQVGAGIRGIGDAANAALAPLRTFSGVMGAVIGIGGAKELQDRADAYIRLTNSLKVATTSEVEFQQALETVTKIAQDTNSDLETTAQLYSRVSMNAKAMGLAQSEVADLTALISKGMQLGGASAAEYAGATLQLTQAFGSGVLRGEEFNSVMEASPELMRQLAAGLGVAIGELRGLAEQGVLTSNIVSKALLSQKDAIDTAYAKTTQTVEQAFTNLGNATTIFAGQLAESSGAQVAATQTLKFLADNLDIVGAALGGALVFALGKATTSTYQYVAASIAARNEAAQQAIAAAAQHQAAILSAEGQLAAAQGAYNRAIAEQRLANEITRLLTAELGVSATEADVAAARARSAAAAQAATVATKNYGDAQTRLIGLQTAGAASAGLLSRAMGFLAGPGGLILLAVSAFVALIPMLSKTKTGTDELTASTDQYANSLERMNAAQLRAREIELQAAIKEQTDAVADAQKTVDGLADAQISLWDVMTDGRPIAVQLTEAQGALADEQQKLDQIQKNLKTTNDALVGSQQQQASVGAEQLVQFVQQGLAMQKLAGTVDELTKQHKAVTDAESSRLQTEIALAEIAGDYQKAEELTLQLAIKRAQASQEQAALDQAAAVAAQARVTAIEGEYQGYQQLTPVQEKALIDAQADALIKQKQADASAALAVQLEQQARSTDIATIAEKAAATQASAYVNALEGMANAQTAVLRAEIALATAKGDTATVQRLTKELAIQEADASAKVAKAKWAEQQAEAAVAIKKLEIANIAAQKNQITKEELALAQLNAEKELAEAVAAGVNSEAQNILAQSLRNTNAAKQGATSATNENTGATKENTEATDGAAKSGGGLAAVVYGLIGYWRQQTGALSEATKALFELKAGLSEGIAIDLFGNLSDEAIKATKEIENANAMIIAMNTQMLYSTGSVGYFMDKVQKAGAQATKAYYEQKIAAEELEAQINKVGTGAITRFGTAEIAVNSMTDSIENSIKGFNLLNDEDLGQIRAALDSANDKLQEMQDLTQSAKDRLTELNAEILEAQGQDKQAELLRQQLDYQQQLAEIEKQRGDAQLAGNTELLRLLDQQAAKLKTLNDLKIKNIEADSQAQSATQKTTSDLNALADATGRVASGLKSMGDIDLSRVTGQAGQLTNYFNDLNGIL